MRFFKLTFTVPYSCVCKKPIGFSDFSPIFVNVVGAVGVEPTRLSALDPKSSVSAIPPRALLSSKSSGSSGARTLDPLIKSQLLYRLS